MRELEVRKYRLQSLPPLPSSFHIGFAAACSNVTHLRKNGIPSHDYRSVMVVTGQV